MVGENVRKDYPVGFLGDTLNGFMTNRYYGFSVCMVLKSRKSLVLDCKTWFVNYFSVFIIKQG